MSQLKQKSLPSWKDGGRFNVDLDYIVSVPTDDDIQVDNVFCPTGPGGGIKPDCGGVSSTGPTTHLEIAKTFHGYNAANPVQKSTILKEHGLSPSSPTSVEQFREHLIQQAHKKLNPTPIAEVIKVSATTHEGTRLKVVALEEKHNAIEAQRTVLAKQFQNPDLTRQDMDKLAHQIYAMSQQQEGLKQEARGIITAALKESNGEQGSSTRMSSMSPLSKRALANDVVNVKAFLDGVVRKDPNGKSTPPVSVEYEAGKRPNYTAHTANPIIETKTNNPTALVHEYGHHLEYTVPGIKEAARDFLAHRIGSEQGINLKEKYPNAGYHNAEEGRKDSFVGATGDERRAYYVGKTYKDGSTEIVSMGLEMLHSNPIRLAKNDPEFFHFMMGLLDGKTRRNTIPKE